MCVSSNEFAYIISIHCGAICTYSLTLYAPEFVASACIFCEGTKKKPKDKQGRKCNKHYFSYIDHIRALYNNKQKKWYIFSMKLTVCFTGCNVAIKISESIRSSFFLFILHMQNELCQRNIRLQHTHDYNKKKLVKKTDCFFRLQDKHFMCLLV